MSAMEQRLTALEDEIDRELATSLRNRSGLTLVAVSKRQPLSVLNRAFQAGLRHFGESQIQEGVPKVRSSSREIIWHFIGHLQRNKVREAVKHFHVLHSVDSLKLLERIESISGEERLSPEVLLQVNLFDDGTKHGLHPSQLEEVLDAALACRSLRCVGLMGIPPAGGDVSAAERFFQELARMRDELRKQRPAWPGRLSMGMSDDFGAAIRAGSNYLRIGTALFGERGA